MSAFLRRGELTSFYSAICKATVDISLGVKDLSKHQCILLFVESVLQKAEHI